jgi:hypothetical protein
MAVLGVVWLLCKERGQQQQSASCCVAQLVVCWLCSCHSTAAALSEHEAADSMWHVDKLLVHIWRR